MPRAPRNLDPALIVGLLSKELNEYLISVSRNSDPVMTIELGLEEMVVNITCACAPQVGCIKYAHLVV